MYGYELIKEDGKGELKTGDLCVTYLAADKYLVEELPGLLVWGSLNGMKKTNVCVLFNQFLKFPFKLEENKVFLNMFNELVQAYSKDAFESESFSEIEEATLIHLLRLEFLNLPESNVLKACLRWTNAEVKRQGLVATKGNKQKVFSKVKPFVRFADLDLEELKEVGELKDVLPPDELTSLFSKLTGWCDRVAIECKTERQKGRKVYEVSGNLLSYLKDGKCLSKISIGLITNRKVCITSIQTTLPILMKNLKLSVYDHKHGFSGPEVSAEFERYLMVDEKWRFEPKTAFVIEPDVSYQFVFTFGDGSIQYFYRDTIFETRLGEYFKLTLSEFGEGHCIKSFTFCEISNYENANSA